MRKIILRTIIFIAAVYGASLLVSGISFTSWQALGLMGLVLALAHTIIKPIIKIITLPISILTFGLFALVINAALFWFAGNIISGFSVLTFVAAFWGGLIVAVANGIFSSFIDSDKD